MKAARDFVRTSAGRRVLRGTAVVFALGVTALAARWFADTGFPLAQADPQLVATAAALFLLAFGVKAYGWSRLFAPHERPAAVALAVAGGAACLTGIALPGRFDDAVRVAVVRRHPGCPAGVRAVALSLFTLGLVETIALTPLASTAAAAASSAALRAALAVVAFAGVGATAVVLLLPRMGSSARLVRFRLSRWLGEHWPTRGDTTTAIVFVLTSWLLRGLGLYLLLAAVGIPASFGLALLFMCAGAASAALPIAPAGAVTQAGAGASILVASGVSVSSALAFAVTAQLLAVMVGASIVLAAALWHGGRRLAVAVAAY